MEMCDIQLYMEVKAMGRRELAAVVGERRRGGSTA
jgi:hypothetical protein